MNENHDNSKTLTLNGVTPVLFLVIILALTSIGICIYLTSHYIDVHFATGMKSKTLCDINDFFSCDKATLSNFSSFFGVPTSIFGLIYSVFILGGAIFPSRDYERTSYLVSLLNAIGCIVFFVYSLVTLEGLCLFCSFYYLTSIAIFLLFHFKGDRTLSISPKYLGGYVVLFLFISIPSKIVISDKEKVSKKEKSSLIKQFRKLKVYEEPKVISPYILNKATDEKEIVIYAFSDFQCPGCKKLSEVLHKMIKKYKKHLTVYYYFYPLDNNCNENIKRSFHPYACEAAYLSACSQEKFNEIHDVIFNNQSDIDNSFLELTSKKYDVEKCYKSKEKMKLVKQIIKAGDDFAIRATPTTIINGRKISGLLTLNKYYTIFDDIIKNYDKK